MTPLKKLSPTAFAASVLLQAVTDAAQAPAKAEAEARITAWVMTAKARYLELVEGIPVPDAEECATTAFSLNCMAGTPGRYHVKPFEEWPDAVESVNADIASWFQNVA